MDVEPTRLPTGTAAWLALVNLTLTLGDLSEVDWLELKGRLPFMAKGDRKWSAVILARAVLGLANRSPGAAERHLGGHGMDLVWTANSAPQGARSAGRALAEQAWRFLPLPAPRPRFNPDDPAVVNLPTWLWTEPSSRSVRVGMATAMARTGRVACLVARFFIACRRYHR